MLTTTEIWEMQPEPPEELHLACGHDVPNAIGTKVYDYYDMRPGTIMTPAVGVMDAQPDTSGMLPGGIAWWVRLEGAHSLDGSRMICPPCAQRKGWT